MDKKILVCTIESWNSKVGANTFSTLFANYPGEKIANLYIREEIPDSKCCSRYFQISEMKAIKSVFNRNIKTGREVVAQECLSKNDEQIVAESRKLYNSNRKKRSYVKLFIREFLWLLSKWNTEELDEYLASVNPDIIVFGMEGYIHFNRICRYAIKKTGAKAIGYFWDDNFTYKQMPQNIGRNMFRFFQRKSLKKLSKTTDAFWAITEKTKQEADAFFGIDCKVLTKPIDYNKDEEWKRPEIHSPIKMLYTGNLLIGRFDVIKAVSDALDKINLNEQKIILDVYTVSYLTEDQLNSLGPHVNMCGAVSQEDVVSLQSSADILLFAEAYKGENSHIARLSFSTKLTDYFYSGKCIFAVGAEDIAPMEYLIKNDVALCASNEEKIYECLEKLVSNNDLINYYANRSYNLGKLNHSRKVIDNVIYKTFNDII